MKTRIKVLIFLVGIPITCMHSQYVFTDYRSEVSLSLGSFFYVGDLTDNLPVFSESQFAWGLAYQHKIKQSFALKLGFHTGKIQAFDSNHGTSSSKFLRNLNFRTQVNEFSLTTNIDILAMIKGKNRDAKICTKIFIGLANFRFDPEALYQDNWYKLNPLGTEGQGLEQYPKREMYSLSQWSIPFGGEIDYKLSENIKLGLCLQLNKTFTDYIDDVSMPLPDNSIILNERGELAAALSDRYINSEGNAFPQDEGTPRGNADLNDWYGIFKISLGYSFNEYWYSR